MLISDLQFGIIFKFKGKLTNKKGVTKCNTHCQFIDFKNNTHGTRGNLIKMHMGNKITEKIFNWLQKWTLNRINDRKCESVAVNNCRSPWCVRTCWLRIAFCLNWRPHSGQLYGFSPVWVRKCWLSIARCRKLRGQYAHVYGFSLAWIRKCCVRWLCWRKRFPHSGQPYGRESVWIRSCCSNVLFCLKSLPQVWHLNSRKSDPFFPGDGVVWCNPGPVNRSGIPKCSSAAAWSMPMAGNDLFR